MLKEFSLSLPREIYRNWVENMERILGYKGIPFVKKKKIIKNPYSSLYDRCTQMATFTTFAAN